MQHSFENKNTTPYEQLSPSLSARTSLSTQEQKLLTQFERAINKSEWKGLEKLLPALVRSESEELKALAVSSRSKDGMTALHISVHRGAPVPLVEKLLDLGASLEERVEGKEFSGSTPLHLAVRKEKEALVMLLLKRGADVNASDADGRRPLDISLELERRSMDRPTTQALLNHGALLKRVEDLKGVNLRGLTISQDLTGVDLREANLIDCDLSQSTTGGTRLEGAWYSAHTKLPRGIDPSFYEMIPAKEVFLKGDWIEASDDDLQRLFLQQLHDGPYQLAGAPWQEVRKLVEASGSYTDGIHYCEVFRDAVKNAGTGSGTALNILLPKLLFTYDLTQVRHLLRGIENAMEWYEDEPFKYHQNEAELLALCNHPRDPELTVGRTGLVTLALTSIDGWAKSDALPKLPRSTVAAWGDIGLLTFSFLNWKFDAQRIYTTTNGRKEIEERSLLEKFGLEAADERYGNVPRNKDFGPSFLLMPGSKEFTYATNRGRSEERTFDKETFIEFRRGYLLVSHPEHGTLIIRNSSPEFGRDLLQHPAYYSPNGIGEKGMGIEALLGFSPDKSLKAMKFSPILEPELYTPTSDAPTHIAFLAGEGMGLKDEYRRWKFDTKRSTAWAIHPEVEEAHLLGGYLSPGFKELVTFLEKKVELASLAERQGQISRGEIPELAIAPSYYPAWVPYTFFGDEGMERRRLIIDDEKLELMKDLVQGVVDPERLQESELSTFLQLAFSTEGELILMSPN